MNREIKFRAWDTQEKKMYKPDFPFIGAGSGALDVAVCIDGRIITPNSFELGFGNHNTVVPEFVLMQFTGLKDKNGTEIYEGDIVRGTTKYHPTKVEGSVHFDSNDFAFAVGVGHDEKGEQNPRYRLFAFNHKTIEVIGNIYQNPELINS